MKNNMDSKTEIRAVIKSFVKVGKNATEAYNFLCDGYGDLCPSKTMVFRYFKEYKEGRESIESERGKAPKPTLRTPENIRLVKTLIEEDRRKTVKELASESGLSVGTIFLIIHDDLGLSKLTARWVPRLLSDEHKKNHLRFARNFKSQYFKGGKAFLESVVTMDETWVSYYTPELKNQSSQWLPSGSRPPTKAKSEISTKKLMLIVFFDAEGMIYQHFVPKNQTINSDYYITVLSQFLVHLRKKRPKKRDENWLFHQDNARPHTSAKTMDFIRSKKIPLLHHPPYSPDLASCDFNLFPALKKNLAGCRFDSDSDVKLNVEGVLKMLSKNGLFHVFEQWSERCDKCILREGDYVEK